MAMRKAVLILSIMSCALVSADARGRHHHGHHFDMYLQAMPGADTPSTQRQSSRRSGRERVAGVAPTDHLLAERSIDTAQIVPRDWKLESPDSNRNGERFVSPDGTAWFEWYRIAAGDKSVAAHMKIVAFADGEELTQVRGERNWIAVSGFRGDRIFCAGDRWHHIAFEYPSNAKGSMTNFIRRAAQALEATQNAGCDIPVSSVE